MSKDSFASTMNNLQQSIVSYAAERGVAIVSSRGKASVLLNSANAVPWTPKYSVFLFVVEGSQAYIALNTVDDGSCIACRSSDHKVYTFDFEIKAESGFSTVIGGSKCSGATVADMMDQLEAADLNMTSPQGYEFNTRVCFGLKGATGIDYSLVNFNDSAGGLGLEPRTLSSELNSTAINDHMRRDYLHMISKPRSLCQSSKIVNLDDALVDTINTSAADAQGVVRSEFEEMGGQTNTEHVLKLLNVDPKDAVVVKEMTFYDGSGVRVQMRNVFVGIANGNLVFASKMEELEMNVDHFGALDVSFETDMAARNTSCISSARACCIKYNPISLIAGAIGSCFSFCTRNVCVCCKPSLPMYTQIKDLDQLGATRISTKSIVSTRYMSTKTVVATSKAEQFGPCYGVLKCCNPCCCCCSKSEYQVTSRSVDSATERVAHIGVYNDVVPGSYEEMSGTLQLIFARGEREDKALALIQRLMDMAADNASNLAEARLQMHAAHGPTQHKGWFSSISA
ncbi:uncharacterized protein MONBRDRAFT_11385 [Monosiga brevicollis MX1]|uniref:Uncharacterized protein n=1 Tax=Monosiga brevicollis TaxID=81824 RepID=A9V936_MONBE|nr:uncharacterized protein MONBRDRAFT_11385 [Monosiga brevicollis MX1]EDQ85985.1 predicted protein [Monosiga brevicollis MX1]|eukprot:XP_001749179.1 hypothetical protein [Monosiga brevicollis MX1]